MQNDLAKILDEYTSEAINSMAAAHKLLPAGSKRKGQVIEVLVKVFSDSRYMLQMLQGLSIAERAFLDAVLRRGDRTSLRNVREELVRLGLIERNPKAAHKPAYASADRLAKESQRLEGILVRLTMLGFVFDADISTTPHSYQESKRSLQHVPTNVFIPEAIRKFLPHPAELPLPKQAPLQISSLQEGSARAFQRDLYLYWSFVRDRSPSLTLKGEIEKRALREVNATLLVRSELAKTDSENEAPRLRFLRGILYQMGLIDIKKDRTLVAGAAPKFFTLPPAERVRTTYDAWRDSGAFNELLLLPADFRPKVVEEAFFPAPSPVISARRFVLHQVKKLSVQGWVAYQTLADTVRALDYEFLFARSSRPYYYYGQVNPYAFENNPLGLEFPNVYGDDSGWDKVEANFIQSVIRGPLFWMGLVDLGWEGPQTGASSAFRLNPLGLWLFKLGPPPQIPAEGGQVIVQPNLHIIALDPIQEATLINLDHFAERLTAERAVEYQLTRLSVYRGQQAGWDAPRIKEFLTAQTGIDLPANVARTLDEWQAQHERIHIYPRVAVAHGSPAVIDSLAADPQTASALTARPLAELALIKNKPAISNIIKSLHARDILPLVTSRPAVEPGSITISESGEIRFTRRAPSLYLHGHLAPFADPVGEGYHITAASVARAATAGLSAPEIIDRLQAAHSGPFPELLARRIRAWARHYGRAALEQVVLFQVRDAETLAELLDDPEVGPLLKPFTPPDLRALARIRPADLEKLRLLLAERGIELNDRLE